MQSRGFADISCRLGFSDINGLHTLSTIGTINPQTPYRGRYEARNEDRDNRCKSKLVSLGLRPRENPKGGPP